MRSRRKTKRGRRIAASRSKISWSRRHPRPRNDRGRAGRLVATTALVLRTVRTLYVRFARTGLDRRAGLGRRHGAARNSLVGACDVIGLRRVAALSIAAILVAIAGLRGALDPTYLAHLSGAAAFGVGLVASAALGLGAAAWRPDVRS